MRFHPEVPLVAFSRLAHIGITGFVLVLSRRRRIDDRRIHYRAAINLQTVLGLHIDQPEHFITQVVTFHQMPEVEYRGLVGDWLLAKVNANKLSHHSLPSWLFFWIISDLRD